ncbi:MAG TPA: hypothetical protein GX699_10770 [Firmicutes bacterium]|nr:hypothetical protein [Bacillota bacterium]
MARKTNRRRFFLFFSAVIITVLIADLLFYRHRIYPGICYNHIHLGGKSWQAAENLLRNFTLTLMLPDSSLLTVRLEELGIKLQTQAMLAEAFRYGRKKRWPFSFPDRVQLYLKQEQLQSVYEIDREKMAAGLSRLCRILTQPPRDAKITVQKGMTVITPEKAGYNPREDALRDALLQYLTSPKPREFLPVPVEPVPPKMTVAFLQENNIRSLRGTFTTTFDAAQRERSHNIKTAAKVLHNSIIGPGETFSVNAVIGDTTPEKGYKKAPVIVGETLVPGYGGGLCQVSTTLYNAALLAGLEIVERHPHGMTVPYVPPGRDATIAYPGKDLKFKNTTGGTLLLTAAVEANDLTFSIFGVPTEAEAVIETTILKVTMPPTRYRTDPGLPPGGERLVEGEPGFLVESRRSFVHRGRVLKTEILSVDNYAPYPVIIYRAPR